MLDPAVCVGMSTEHDQGKVKNEDLSEITAANLKKVKAEQALQMLKPRPALDEILNLNDSKPRLNKLCDQVQFKLKFLFTDLFRRLGVL